MSQPLHQQEGGISLRDFAQQSGLSERHILNCAKAGRIIGARQDSRSKKWTIYPPAILTDKYGERIKRSEASSAVDVGTSPHGLSADLAEPHQETPEGSSLSPSAKPVLTLPDNFAAPMPRARRSTANWRDADSLLVYRRPEVQSVLRILREAAARQYREGIHYLRLEGRELSQLYAALDHERSRIRKLIGKGLVDVGNLRASDSAWQKLQAICQQGRVL